MRRKSAERAMRMHRRLQTLPPRKQGTIMAALLANALATLLLDAVLAVVLTRAAHRAWRQRHLGPGHAVRSGLTPAVGWAVGTVAAYQAARACAVQVVDRRLRESYGGENPSPS